MTFPLKELFRLLKQENTQMGVVVAMSNATIEVATAQGAMTVPSQEALKVGDRVLVRNGMATRAPVATRTFAV